LVVVADAVGIPPVILQLTGSVPVVIPVILIRRRAGQMREVLIVKPHVFPAECGIISKYGKYLFEKTPV